MKPGRVILLLSCVVLAVSGQTVARGGIVLVDSTGHPFVHEGMDILVAKGGIVLDYGTQHDAGPVSSPAASDAEAKGGIKIDVLDVGTPDGGRLRCGQPGLLRILFTNRSKSRLLVPLSPRLLGKGCGARNCAPSYTHPAGGYFAGARIPRCFLRFEDAQGKVIEEIPFTMDDIGFLSPGGRAIRHCVFRSPTRPGTYHLRVVIDTAPLQGDLGFNITGIYDETSEVFVSEEILLENLCVEKQTSGDEGAKK